MKDANGVEQEWQMPRSAVVESKVTAEQHYALVCHSDVPLVMAYPEDATDSFSYTDVYSLSSADPDHHLKPSPRTLFAVCYAPASDGGGNDKCVLRARLVPPYIVRMAAPDERVYDEATDTCVPIREQ